TSSSAIRTFPSPRPNEGWAFPRFVKRLDLENSAHLKDDGFAIRCDVDVMSDLGLHVEETFLDVPEPDLRVHLARLLRTKDGADVAFKVGDETFGAHSCMLAARSPVFKAELSGHKADTCVKIDG
uniref:BTB domain-containing protein n=1 Tax=Triticum urartu TaxID=4572 RepID=A0A8R7PQF2_TRIUA